VVTRTGFEPMLTA